MESDQANLLMLSVLLLYLIVFVSAQIYPKVRSEVRRKIKIRREARAVRAAEKKRDKEPAKEFRRSEVVPYWEVIPYWNRPSTKTPNESSGGKPFGATRELVNLLWRRGWRRTAETLAIVRAQRTDILVILALIAILFLPIAPIESDVSSIPGHNWIMSEEAADWETDEISDQSQFRSGLFFCFCFGLFGMMIGGLIAFFGGDAGIAIGGLMAAGAFFAGTVMWLWGTLALGFFEILAGNPYWIADLVILIGSIVLDES